MRLPRDIETIVLEYLYSLLLFEIRQKLHRELRHLWMLQEVKIFYDVFYSPLNPYPPFPSTPEDL